MGKKRMEAANFKTRQYCKKNSAKSRRRENCQEPESDYLPAQPLLLISEQKQRSRWRSGGEGVILCDSFADTSFHLKCSFRNRDFFF